MVGSHGVNVISWLVIAALLYIFQFLVCGGEMVDQDQGIFVTIVEMGTFTACGESESIASKIFSLALFLIVAVPGAIIIVEYTSRLFNSNVGAATAIVLGLFVSLLSVVVLI